MVTDNRWQDFYVDVHTAAETMQDDWETRYVPSPSTVASCRLRQWFQGHDIPRTDRIPVDSEKKMESGKVIEDFWREVYTRAGFDVVSPMTPLSIGHMKSRGGDGKLYVTHNKSLGLPRGTAALLELKDMGAWSYCSFYQDGAEKAFPDYWMQVQTYLYAYDLEYCVFHAGMADASGTKWIWRRIKKLGEDVPPFWLEVIKRDPVVANAAIERASEVRWGIDHHHPDQGIPLELRDFDSPKLYPEGKFPCGYCGWGAACAGAQPPDNIINLEEVRNQHGEGNRSSD